MPADVMAKAFAGFGCWERLESDWSLWRDEPWTSDFYAMGFIHFHGGGFIWFCVECLHV